jgi:hypothetical protein
VDSYTARANSYKHYPGTDAVYVRVVLLSTLAREWKPGYRDRPFGALSAGTAGSFQNAVVTEGTVS